jgi:F1F0 ATPase subunit 2
LACLSGSGLAAIFVGGLWWTVRKGVLLAQPALWFFTSLLLRTAIVLAGFYFVGHNDWKRLLACLLGFFVARVVFTMAVTWLAPVLHHAVQEAQDAPYAG